MVGLFAKQTYDIFSVACGFAGVCEAIQETPLKDVGRGIEMDPGSSPR
jgi:hypothetical protein